MLRQPDAFIAPTTMSRTFFTAVISARAALRCANLPAGSTRVLRERIYTTAILCSYLGTEFAAFASINRGGSWFKINGPDLPDGSRPRVRAANDGQRDGAGTHGRSPWVLDVTTLRQLKDNYWKARDRPVRAGDGDARWQLDFTRDGMRSAPASRHVGWNGSARRHDRLSAANKTIQTSSLKILDEAPRGLLVRELDRAKEKEAGMHRVGWDSSERVREPPEAMGKTPYSPYEQPVKTGRIAWCWLRTAWSTCGLRSPSLTALGEGGPTAVNEIEELRKLLKQRP